MVCPAFSEIGISKSGALRPRCKRNTRNQARTRQPFRSLLLDFPTASLLADLAHRRGAFRPSDCFVHQCVV